MLDRIYRIVDEGGPFDEIFANSEGATIAATFLVSPSWDILSLVYSQIFSTHKQSVTTIMEERQGAESS